MSFPERAEPGLTGDLADRHRVPEHKTIVNTRKTSIWRQNGAIRASVKARMNEGSPHRRRRSIRRREVRSRSRARVA
jgi:hypothetical protein